MVQSLIEYATFKVKDYEPSVYGQALCDKATEVYQMYLDGKIANKQYADEVAAGTDEVEEYFIAHVDEKMKDDVNYETILDDLLLYVDENNAKLCSWALI